MKPICSLILLLSTGYGLADRIHFSDGRPPKEGKVVLDTPSVVELKWEERPGIFRTDRFSKAVIERIEIDTKEDIQFKKMGQLVPAPDRLTVEDYQRRIAKCTAFLEVFPDGKHAENVKTVVLAALQDELSKAEAGGLKLDGKWIRPAERIRDAYSIDAGLELSDMKEAREAGNHMMAMRHFDTLKSEFMASANYAEARELAIETLAAYGPIVQRGLSQVQFKRQDRERALATLRPNVRVQAKEAQDQADAEYRKLVERETTELKTKWLTLNDYHGDQMRAVLNSVRNTLASLEKETAPEEETPAGPLYRSAWDAARGGDFEGAQEILKELKSLKIPARYLDPLEAATQPPEEPEPEPEPEPDPEPDPEPEPEPEPDSKTDKQADSKTKERTPTPREPSTTATDNSIDKGGSSKIQTILVVVLILVIVGALAAAYVGKKKA